MAAAWDRFRSVSSAALDWENELTQTEQEIASLEKDLAQKRSVLSALHLQLDLREDRQRRFRRLIEILESASGCPEVADRKGELLHMAQSLYSALADHEQEIANRQNNPKTLRDLLLLLADFDSRFQRVRIAAFRRGVIGSATAFQSTALGIEVGEPES
jgi:chromosome segregation ATPase